MGTTLSKGKQQLAQEIPTFKIVLVGEPGVGKSSIFLRYTRNQFDYSYQPSVSVTIGNVVRKINIPYQGVVSVVIWDVPGREEMDLRKSYYKDVDAAIVVVDVSDIDTIGLAPTWKQDVLNHAQTMTLKDNNSNKFGKVDQGSTTSQDIPVLLLGNKVDKLELKSDDTTTDTETDAETDAEKAIKELEETASKHGFIGSVTVSAKGGEGSVHAAIQVLVRRLLQTQVIEKKKTRKPLANIFGSTEISNEDEIDSQKTCFTFLKVNINEFDNLFKTCEEPMETIENCGQEYFQALRMFKRSCCVANLTPTFKSSLEDCITGLKENVVDDNHICGLKGIDDAGFVSFIINDDIIDDVPRTIHKIIRIFHTKVAIAAKGILTKCSVAHGSLKDSENQLEHLCNSFDELSKNAGVWSEKASRRAWGDIQANRTRLAEAHGTALEYLQNVENDCKKIKAALLW